jgi:hypothetical protein
MKGLYGNSISAPEFTDPVFAKTKPKRSFSVIENERCGLVFVKTGSKNLGTGYSVRTSRITVWKELY